MNVQIDTHSWTVSKYVQDEYEYLMTFDFDYHVMIETNMQLIILNN